MNKGIIRIEHLLEIFMKRWKFIIVITLIITGISTIISFFMISPKYEANTKLFIGKENGRIQTQDNIYGYDDIDMYQKLLKTYAEVIETNDLIERAVILENLGLSSEDVLKNLRVIPRSETQILEVRYTSTDKFQAKEILDSITAEFIKSVKELIPSGNVKIIEKVKIPEKAVSPNKIMNIAAAFFLGLMISIGLIILLELMDNTFKREESIEEILELPVLGIIPDFTND